MEHHVSSLITVFLIFLMSMSSLASNIVCFLLNNSVQFSSVTQSCPTLCDPMNHSTPGLPANHQLLEFTHAIQPSHPLLSPSPPAPNPSQHQGLFRWVNCSHEVAKVLEFQLQYQSFHWTVALYYSPQNSMNANTLENSLVYKSLFQLSDLSLNHLLRSLLLEPE